MTELQALCAKINEQFADWIEGAKIVNYPSMGSADVPAEDREELTVTVKPDFLIDVCTTLRDAPEFAFGMLVDMCGIDYLHYGLDDWETQSATETGFARGVTQKWYRENPAKPTRFAVIYHLLSLTHNRRIRLCVPLPDHHDYAIASMVQIWPCANWFEREIFDLFGIPFKGHPDLRRILTDYGFVGHPFRKDFPMIGKVEARYDAQQKRIVYEPVSIQMRILEPKVIRHDNRYVVPSEEKK